MRRFFARNLLFVVGINVLVKPVWIFLIDRNVQIRVGHANFGTYTALFNISVIFQIILDFGLNSYNTRTISAEPERIRTLFSTLLSARIALFGLYEAVVLLAGYILGYRGPELWLLAGTTLLQGLTIILLFIRSNVASLQRFKLDGVLSVTDRLLMILLCSFLLWSPFTASQFKIEWFVVSQIGCYTVAIVFGMYVLHRIARVPFRLHFHFGSLKEAARQGAPYALLAFLMAIHMRSDVTILERMSPRGKDDAGVFVAASRLLEVGNMMSIMFAAVLMPLFGRMLAEKTDIAPIVRLSMNLLLPLSLFISVGAWLLGPQVMHILFPASGAYEARVFSLLMMAYPAYSCSYIYATLLTANGNIRTLNVMATIGVLISIMLNLFIIPKQGAPGAAAVAAITQWFLAICAIFFATKEAGLPKHPVWVAAHIGYFLLLCSAALTLHYLQISWPVNAIMFGLIAAAGVLVFRFVAPSALRSFLLRR